MGGVLERGAISPVADYSQSFNDDIDGKRSVIAANPTGFLEPAGVEYDSIPQRGCEACAGHVANGGDHETVDRHFCTVATAQPPFADKYLYRMDVIRQSQAMLHYFQWIVGWKESFTDYLIGGLGHGAWAQGPIFPIIAASGNQLTLRCNSIDPRNYLIASYIDPDDDIPPPTVIAVTGMIPAPGDMVDFGGSTVLAGRLRCKVVSVDFNGLPDTPGAFDTFTVTVDQDVSYAMTPPSVPAPALPNCLIWREGLEPERWIEPKENLPMFVVPRESVFEIWQEGDDEVGEKFMQDEPLPLLDADELLCLNAFPVATQQETRGTLRVWKSTDGIAWTEITSSAIGRFVVTQVSDVHRETHLWLGGTRWDGDDQANLISGSRYVRVWHNPHVDDSAVVGAYSPCNDRCQHARRDYNNVIANATGFDGFDIDPSGSHWFCARRNNPLVKPENLAAFTHNCAQAGSCGGFEERSPQSLDENILFQISSAQNATTVKKIPGLADLDNYTIRRINTPSLCWLLNAPAAYKSKGGFYQNEVFPNAGGYVMRITDKIKSSGDIRIDAIAGAIWNYIADGGTVPCDWETNRFGNDEHNLHGILKRRIPDALIPHTQMNDPWNFLGEAFFDPHHNQTVERFLRRIPTVKKDATAPGEDAADDVRDVAGLEGENRLQRTRTYRKHVIAISKGIATAQGRLGYETATEFPQVDGTDEEIRVRVRLRAGGRETFGVKRHGRVLLCEKVSSVNYRIHCYPGLYVVSQTINPPLLPSYDATAHFYASGNIVELPEPYRPNGSYYNSPREKMTAGSAAYKAIHGDTIEFDSMPGRKFYILRAEAGVGIDFSPYSLNGISLGGNPTYDPNNEFGAGIIDRGYYKRCDLLTIQDAGDGILVQRFNTLGEDEFEISTDGVIAI